MASQIGTTREYTHVDEATSPKLKTCPLCKVKAVPRGITSTRESATGEKHCPNCGHVHGRDNH
jgi:transposase